MLKDRLRAKARRVSSQFSRGAVVHTKAGQTLQILFPMQDTFAVSLRPACHFPMAKLQSPTVSTREGHTAQSSGGQK